MKGITEGLLTVSIKGIDQHTSMDAFRTHDLSILPPGWDIGQLQDVKNVACIASVPMFFT